MKRQHCRTIREIYDDYQYEMAKISMALEEIRIADIVKADELVALLDRIERLEALVDLYAYLLACQDHNQPASS